MAGRPKLLTRAPRIDDRLARPRLIAAADQPFVIVYGPPGSGVTTAAAQIATATPPGSTVAWCRLSTGYDTASDIVGMAADSLGREVPPARRVVELADQLLELAETTPLTVVVDDHQFAADGDVDRMLAECAELLPPGSRIIVAADTRPAGLLGLLPHSQRAVLGPAELAFTDDEAEALFEGHGAPADAAHRWNRELGGWAHGVAAGVHAPDGDPSLHLTALLDRVVAADPSAGNVVDAAAAAPYVTLDVMSSLGPSLSSAELSAVVESTPLLTDHGGFVRMTEFAASTHRESMIPERVAELRRSVAATIADDDPTTAIDLLLDADEPHAAADVLADHLSEIGVERALNWLYRLPADLRRRFPPVLAAGQATVEVDLALADAEGRVEKATTERARREALLALGSVEAHRGELSAAATALEAALRTTNADPTSAERISIELATTRWHLGDLVGARAALAGLEHSTVARWLTAQIDVVEGAPPIADGIETPGTDDAYALATEALVALSGRVDDERAAELAATAYAAAVDGGGDPFVAASAVHAWSLLRLGRPDEALTVAETLERRVGPRHHLGRLHGAIIRERCSRGGDDAGQHDRDRRRLRDLRTRGFATVERLAALVLDEPAGDVGGPAFEVRVLGEHEARCDGRRITRAEWKSKKAFEVLTVLAAGGPSGCRREETIEAVWPGRPPDKGRTLLRTALSEIRRVLEPDRQAGEPSKHLVAGDDIVRTSGSLDLDRLEETFDADPTAALAELSHGLASSIAAAEWAQEWSTRIERLTVRAAMQVPDDAERPQRIAALEALIGAEPWQRTHYDSLARIHREGGDEAAAADVERRWFADD